MGMNPDEISTYADLDQIAVTSDDSMPITENFASSGRDGRPRDSNRQPQHTDIDKGNEDGGRHKRRRGRAKG